MSGDDGVTLLWGIGSLVLVGSALLAHRLPFGRMVKYALAWVAIFALLYGLVLFRGDFAEIAARARADLGFGHQAAVQGSTTIVHRADDGHYWVTADVGGKPVDFLIDTGATVTTLTAETAHRLGVTVDRSGLPLIVDTANGPIETWPGQIDDIAVGSISMPSLEVQVSDVPDSVNLLGMNWLSALRRWRVEGREMILEP